MIREIKHGIIIAIKFLLELTFIQVFIYCIFYFLFKQNYIQLINENLRLPIEGLIINLGTIIYFIKSRNLTKPFLRSLKCSESPLFFIISFIILAFVILLILLSNLYLDQISIVLTHIDLIKIVTMAPLIFLLAGSEEIITRFILFEIIKANNNLMPIIISSFIFSLLHVFNPNIGILPLVNIFLFAIIMATIYSIKKSLWLIIFFHFLWNYITGCLIGSNLSGIKLDSVLRLQTNKDTLINGGQFGFEGSIILTCLLFFIVIIFIRSGNLKAHSL